MINPSSWRVLLITALSLPLSLSLAACGGDDSGVTDAGTTSDGGTTAGDSSSTSGDDDDDDDGTTTGGTTAGPGTTTDDPSTSTTDDPSTTEDPSTTGEPLMVNAFRWNSMEIQDPHFFLPLGCGLDITDQVNPLLSDAVTMDGDDPPDGSLDLNFVMLFPDPLNQGADGEMELAIADTCLVPLAAPVCSLGNGQVNASSYTSDANGCLAPDPDHLNYGLSTDPVPGPCFTSGVVPSIELDVGGFVLPLRDVEISGTYEGDPATGVVNGIMRGFLTEEDGQNTTLPDDTPVVVGNPIADLVCKGEDMDDNNGTPGWWFYVTFTANSATWNG